jgi:LCP family protein required for cell wall assembly
VKTTLKRGFGRVAAFDGNGRAVLPPGVLTPVTLYRQPAPEQRRGLLRVGRILLWFAAAVVMLAASLLGGVYLFLHESVAATRAHSADVRTAQAALDDIPAADEPATALVVGYDRRATDPKGSLFRSDTVMLVRADPQTQAITLLSFPRDLVVDVRCPGGASFRGRINAAYAECGARGTLETVRQLTGLPISYLVTVNFRGFKQIVAALGGVWIDVDRRYFNDPRRQYVGFKYAAINLLPGYQKLNGQQALDFVRYRHTDSDLYRIARQQVFVKAFKEQVSKEVAGSYDPRTLARIVGAITRNVEIGVGGGGELSGRTILRYAKFAYELPPGHFFQAKIEGLQGYAELYTDPSNIQAAIQEFTNPDVDAPVKATAVALGRKAKLRSGPAPRDTTLTVLNGNGVEGSAANASYLLTQRGYQVVLPPNGALPNAPSFNYFTTKIYFNPRREDAQLAARRVADLFGAADVERLPRDIDPLSNAMLTVVVGQTFHNSLAPAPVDRTPKRQPPYVRKDPAATLTRLRPLRRSARFTLELPTVLERTSSLDPELPVRVYEMGGHRTVRLTYRTGASEYWGIQQTDWEDAPVLAGRNARQRIGGRTFDLYYSGSHLHMVVLHENDATYWVINTLVDSLSNETMLAIAKGLHPLRK